MEVDKCNFDGKKKKKTKKTSSRVAAAAARASITAVGSTLTASNVVHKQLTGGGMTEICRWPTH